MQKKHEKNPPRRTAGDVPHSRRFYPFRSSFAVFLLQHNLLHELLAALADDEQCNAAVVARKFDAVRALACGEVLLRNDLALGVHERCLCWSIAARGKDSVHHARLHAHEQLACGHDACSADGVGTGIAEGDDLAGGGSFESGLLVEIINNFGRAVGLDALDVVDGDGAGDLRAVEVQADGVSIVEVLRFLAEIFPLDLEYLEFGGVESLVGLFQYGGVKPSPASAGHHEEVHGCPAVVAATVACAGAGTRRFDGTLHADFETHVLGEILLGAGEVDTESSHFAGVGGLGGVGYQHALAAFGFGNFVFVNQAVEIALVVAFLPVGFLQGIQNIRVENGVGALLAGDDGHVAVVFGAGIPNVGDDAVGFRVLGDLAVEECAALQVELEVCGVGNLAGALDGAEFADNHGNAVGAVHCLEFAEGLCDLVRGTESAIVDAVAVHVPAHVVGLVGSAFEAGVVVELRAPIFVSSHQGILVGVVVHFGHHVAVAGRVGGPAGAEHGGHVHFGTRGLHNQGAGGVVAAGVTHGGKECLVVALQDLHTGVVEFPLAVVAPWVVHTRFVGACKEEVLVVVLEVGRNLGPEGSLAGLGGGGVVGDVAGATARVGCAVKNAVFEPAFVPVGVQHHVHAFGDDHVHDFFHLGEPCAVNGRVREGGVLAHVLVGAIVGGTAVGGDVLREGVGMGVPGAGNAHGVEACVLDCLDVGGSRERVAPGGGVFRHFHGVADVVAHAHGRDQFGCLGECERSRACERERAEHETKLSDTKHIVLLWCFL